MSHTQGGVPNGRLPDLLPIARRLRRGDHEVQALVFLEAGEKHRRSLSTPRYPPAPIERQRQRRAKVRSHRRGWEIEVGTPLCTSQAIVLQPGLAGAERRPDLDL